MMRTIIFAFWGTLAILRLESNPYLVFHISVGLFMTCQLEMMDVVPVVVVGQQAKAREGDFNLQAISNAEMESRSYRSLMDFPGEKAWLRIAPW